MKSRNADRPRGAAPCPDTPCIRAEQLCKHYGTGHSRIDALRDVSFEVARGERIAITGRSGSGKSTLLNLLAGLDRADSGSLVVDGQSLGQLARREMANYRLTTVGVVFQAFQLIPQRTAFQNVELPLVLKGVARADRQAAVCGALERVGLSDRMTHFPHSLSGGEQQRVAIARALINRPSVLFADEPTGNLDVKTADSIVALIDELCATSGLTYVLVTHDEALAKRHSDRWFHMTDGELRDR